jgi:hypothetical protein
MTQITNILFFHRGKDASPWIAGIPIQDNHL